MTTESTFTSETATSGPTSDPVTATTATTTPETGGIGGDSDAEFEQAWAVIRGGAQAAQAEAIKSTQPETPAEGEPATEPGTPSPPAEQASEQQPTGDGQEEQPTDKGKGGPGDLRVALHQARQESAELKRELSELRAEKERSTTEARQRDRDQRYQELLAEDPEAAANFLLEEAEADREAERKAAEAERVNERVALSIDYAKASVGEEKWNATIAHIEAFENEFARHLPEGASFINWDAVRSSPNAGKAVLALAELLPSNDAIEARIAAGIAEGVKAAQAQLQQASQPASPRAPRGIDSVPSAAPAAGAQLRDPVDVDTSGWTSQQFHEWKDRVLYGR